MKPDVPVHAVKDSLIRLRKAVNSLLDNWEETRPVREDFQWQYSGDCDYQIGEFKIIDSELKTSKT